MKQTYNLQPLGCCPLKHLRCVAHVDAEHVEEVMPVGRVCATCIAERQRRGSIACLDPVRIKEAGVVRACCERAPASAPPSRNNSPTSSKMSRIPVQAQRSRATLMDVLKSNPAGARKRRSQAGHLLPRTQRSERAAKWGLQPPAEAPLVDGAARVPVGGPHHLASVAVTAHFCAVESGGPGLRPGPTGV